VPIPFDREAFTRGVFKSPSLLLDFGVEYVELEGVRDKELLYYRDGINATVSVHRGGATTFLRVNGKPDASSHDDMPTQVMLGEIPLLFGAPAKSVLVIGYASGVTVGSVVRHAGVERVDAVEIEPAIVEASRFFDRESGRPLDDPRVELVLDDARSYLAATGRRYDVIVSEPSNPWMSGVSNLFTREFFAIARGALAPGGRLLQWVQLYAMDPQALYSILAAVRAEFPYVYGFANEEGSSDLFLLAMERPLGRDDLPRWDELPAAVRADLERVGTYSTADLWSLVRLLPADVDALVARAPVVNTDDNLYIELGTPLMLQEDTLTPNWEAFARFPRGVLPLLEGAGEPVDARLLGELALSYIERRTDPTVGPELLRVAQERGRSAPAIVAAVILGRSVDAEGTFAIADQIASLDDAIALEPDAFAPRLLRAEILVEAENHPAALEAIDAALLVRPDDARARALRARTLYALERYEEALGEIETLAASVARLDDELGQRQAELYLRTGRTAEAVAAFERELDDNDPTWLEGWVMLAQAYAESGDTGGAERARRNAQATLRNRARSYQWLARSALWRGWNDEAIPLLETALKAEPDNPLIASDLAALRTPQDASRAAP
ncbi:MAG: tetratricopeptide repeat protein, partial [Thermodesulfobacteriota bacterium]